MFNIFINTFINSDQNCSPSFSYIFVLSFGHFEGIENLEEGVAVFSLGDSSLGTSLFISLLLADGLLGEALAFLPVDFSTFDLGGFSGFLKDELDSQDIVGEEFVFSEIELKGEISGSFSVFTADILNFLEGLQGNSVIFVIRDSFIYNLER